VAEEIKTVASVGAPFMNSYSRKLGRNERFSWEMSIFGMAIIECRTFFVKHRAATGLVIVFIFFSSRIVLRFMVCFMTPPRRIVGAVIRESRLLRSDTPERYHGRVLYHRPF
jgi:hypothetical protein